MIYGRLMVNQWLIESGAEPPGVANDAAEPFRVLTPGKRQSWTPVKTDGWQWPKVYGCGQSRPASDAAEGFRVLGF